MNVGIGLSLLVLVPALAPSAAFACSPVYEAYYDLISFAPADGAEDVPPDSALRFAFSCANPTVPGLCEWGVPNLRVRMTAEGSDEPIPGTRVPFGDQVLFVPAAPLTPNANYDVFASIYTEHEEVSGDGVRMVSFRFRTGEALSPTPTETEPSSSRFEPYAAPVAECPSSERYVGQEAVLRADNSSECEEDFCALVDDTEPVARVVLTSGQVTGPFDAEGYLWIMDVADRYEPDNAIYTERKHLAQGEVATFSWDLYGSDRQLPDEACARLRVMDAAGKMLEVHRRCFDVAETRQGVLEDPSDFEEDDGEYPPLGEDFDDAPADAGDMASESPTRHVSRCSTGMASDSLGALWMLAAALALRRRRQTT